MLSLEWKNKLTEFLSEKQIQIDEHGSHPLGNSGHVTVYPQSEEEISNILRYANTYGKTVCIAGGGTKRGFGGQLECADILLSLVNYSGIVEHAAADMTVTVKSGTVFQQLQDYLAEYRQKVALDPVWPQYATIGGVISANDSGPKRLGYGSARDSVIGLRIVYPDGTVIRSGGKVVKNVAGYDMNKLFIGAMGTLGVISEITLKLRPLPKYESLVLLSFPSGKLDEIRSFAVQFLDSMMEPVCFELLSPSLSERLIGHSAYTLAIGFEDVESAVRYQVEFVKRFQPPNTKILILSQEEAKSFWQTFYTIGPNGAAPDPLGQSVEAAVKIGVVNFDVLPIIRESDLLQERCHVHIEAHGGLGHGLCQVYIKGESEPVIAAVKQLRATAAQLGGYAVVKHLPFSLRKRIDVWGEKPSYFFLLDGIKRKIDPNRILNNQRFIGGI
ncbi:FAD-binding oxidoreductase [Parageobacillus thermoglucosidasius]|uniref:Lactate dehydrogenase n=2 Tax=Anoxybacillaceae TaxID=3120669 RepID=A0AAN1D7F1_PARTM|nr:FAD-binding oxidoreductase [Parageobacillus thermoglucosidasius]AEH47678.1 D-lactate dehydrogenase (cytochrome) [Parageobacillus thermoglucosidasius C56-YS93]ALF11077.1 lactate dehydrogenase [Parageobacillus thermoglucosidasius]ANZ31154.1 lactate dehydrogenase [Parageobacillus thermoglucosidasius]APM81891.1 lactate dehydrogenase [Parageobacillus thermoglucosidasius]KJX67954.1 lactate dehydrogenase [Parageobacillus thermoglucosidasius]